MQYLWAGFLDAVEIANKIIICAASVVGVRISWDKGLVAKSSQKTLGISSGDQEVCCLVATASRMRGIPTEALADFLLIHDPVGFNREFQ